MRRVLPRGPCQRRRGCFGGGEGEGTRATVVHAFLDAGDAFPEARLRLPELGEGRGQVLELVVELFFDLG